MATFIKKEAILDKSISTSKVQSGFLDELISTLSKDKLKSTLVISYDSMWSELAVNSGFYQRLAYNNNFVSMMVTGSGMVNLADNNVFQGRLATASFFGSWLGANFALASKLAENPYFQSNLGTQVAFLQKICGCMLIDSYGFTTAQYSQFANKSAFNEALAANSGFLAKLTPGIVGNFSSANLEELASKLSQYLSSYFISLQDGGGSGGGNVD